jgi:hypothetical protein
MREDYPYMEKSVGPDYVSFRVVIGRHGAGRRFDADRPSAFARLLGATWEGEIRYAYRQAREYLRQAREVQRERDEALAKITGEEA